ncbi:MAG: hypothetical protein JWM64_2183 [Frankiales bacterium]|nr:hypothetical protein [Frankiales bacterium]
MNGSPFRGSTSGRTKQQLRNRSFRRETRDVYVLAEERPSLALRVRALQLAVPDAVASHVTAAQLQELPVPRDPLIHLTRPAGRPASARPGVRTHRRALCAAAVLDLDGLRVTAPARTWLDLAGQLGRQPLVALGDAVVRRVGHEQLLAEVAAAIGQRGVVRARAALDELDGGADSAAESVARLLLHDAGFRGLRHQVTVRDEHGSWVSRPDLADELARVAVQYDGLVHFERGVERWRADIDRDEQTRAAGWQVVVLTALDLRRPDRAVAKVEAAYRRAGH